jgi:glycosyltransferase involved in cell wall biosynthesis
MLDIPRRLDQIITRIDRQSSRLESHISKPSFSERFPFTTHEAFVLFKQALARLPKEHTGLLQQHSAVAFDSLLWAARNRKMPMLELLSYLKALAEPPARIRLANATPPAKPKPEQQKLKVLFVTGMFPGVEHGGGLSVFDMIVELASRGHAVSLYTPEDRKGSAKTLDLLKPHLKSYRLVQQGSFRASDYQSWLRRENTKFDAIHYVWPNCATLIPAGRDWTRTSLFELIESCTRRCLIDIERFLGARHIHALERSTLELVINWKLEQEAIAASDEVIALTDTDAQFSSQVFGVAEVGIIPQGISQTFVLDRVQGEADIAPAFGDQSAVFIGNYNHYPNKDGLLWFLNNVHDKVLAEVPSFRLVVAGAGDIADIQTPLAAKSSVVFLGEVEDLVGTLQSGKVCLAPLVSGAGIRGKVNQYSSVCRPTVSTRIGACGTPYQHEKSIMIADDPNEFASHIVRLITDRSLYETIRSNANKVAIENFSWKPLINNLENIYVR